MRLIKRPWMETLYGYDPDRVAVTDTEDPDAVSDEDLALMEAAEGPPKVTPPPAPKPRRTRNPGRGRTV